MMPVRIQRMRRKGWRMPPNTVYVGRGSMWGNPYRIVNEEGFPLIEGPDGTTIAVEGGWGAAHQLAVDLYRERFLPNYMSPASLRGKNLACWCAHDQACHADVLLDAANSSLSSADRKDD